MVDKNQQSKSQLLEKMNKRLFEKIDKMLVRLTN